MKENERSTIQEEIPQAGVELHSILLSSVQQWLMTYDDHRVRYVGGKTVGNGKPHINMVIPESLQHIDLETLPSWYWDLIEYQAALLEDNAILGAEEIQELLQLCDEGNTIQMQAAVDRIAQRFELHSQEDANVGTQYSMIDLHDFVRSLDIIIHAPKIDRKKGDPFFALSKEEQTNLTDLGFGFSYLYSMLMHASEIKTTAASVPISILEKLIEISAAKIQNFLRYIHGKNNPILDPQISVKYPIFQTGVSKDLD